MTNTTTSARYTTVAILLHWIIAIGVIANIGLAELTEDMSREARGPYMDWHKSIGITILALTVVRLVWRLGHKPPPLPADTPGWQAAASKISHILFYVLLIGLPLGGWLWMSTYPAPWQVFGLFEMPMLPVAGNEALGEALHAGHGYGGDAMFYLVILHLLAVAKHMIIDKHPILRRMLPGGAA